MVRAIRKSYIIFFFFFVCARVLIAGSDEELFLRGNNYYAAKDYEHAFSTYDMIAKKGSAVLYNMGNCLFYTNDYSRALVYWSRAEIGATTHEYKLIAQNKEQALKKMGKHTGLSVWQQAVNSTYGVLPYISLFFLQLFF